MKVLAVIALFVLALAFLLAPVHLLITRGWAREGWDGDPANLDTTRRAVVHIVPSDRDYSYISAEIWHSRFCPRRHFRNDGNHHRHGGRCRLISSEEHVTWHIKSGR